ncbi:hypothetical protein O181_063766 [Austropuccinia psidii MF-1]|uniref:Uncharacterized protein n=1 Tax=Austropuccinia psidii MF-1 TaxID=1389203 RepID=A0A9Q3HZP4_9BASI|nr:hypothetical protein [Austropuccinia psidii MF-1]
MSLKAQTHFNTIHIVQVISPHWLPHPRLILPNASHAYAPALPPHLRPHTPALTIFRLKWCPPNMPPTPLTILMLVKSPPDNSLTPLTILMLVECPPDMALTPLTILMLV